VLFLNLLGRPSASRELSSQGSRHLTDLTNRKLHKRLHTHRKINQEQVDLNDKVQISGPSDGTRTVDPLLPWNVSGNWWQPMATDLACFLRVSRPSDLPLIATGCNHGPP
jgi:hypothetical protein